MKYCVTFLLFVLSLPLGASERYVTLLEGEVVAIPEDMTALIVFVGGQESIKVLYERPDNRSIIMWLAATGTVRPADAEIRHGTPTSIDPLPLTGPATFTVVVEDQTQTGIISLKLVPSETSGRTPSTTPQEGVPSNAVVIPQDISGEVEVILESSGDLVTWNGALPGKYSAETAPRFFRVRAVAD